MTELEFIALRGESAIDNLAHPSSRMAAREVKPGFTRKRLTEWLNAAREPWRTYFPYRPDDMPPKGGNPAALARLLKELGE